jgi:AcrR family transcriptional regulator
MTVAVATTATPNSEDSRYEKLRCGVRGPKGLTGEQVRENQRTRLYEAMLEITATGGYQAATIKAVAELAGVSRRTFYNFFPASLDLPHPKEACFLGAYDHTVDRAVERITAAYDSEDEPRRGLCRAFEQFALEVISRPQVARFALMETFSAGPAALERMERVRQRFEKMIVASIPPTVEGEVLSPTIAKGIVGGIERITRVYLMQGRIEELPATAAQLATWVYSYRPRHQDLQARSPVEVSPRAQLRAENEGLRILQAAIAIAANKGYSSLSPYNITRLADADEDTFARIYDGADPVKTCFLAGFDMLGAEALLCAARAARDAAGWTDGVRSGIEALFAHVAAHPYLGRVAFIEIFAVGPSAIERRSTMLGGFADVFTKRVPEPERPSELLSEAIVGGIWAIIHDHVARRQVHRLPERAGDAVYLALAPLVGHEAADALISQAPARPISAPEDQGTLVSAEAC